MLARTAKHFSLLENNTLFDEALLHSYLIDYLASLFEEPFTDYLPSSAREFDSWYRNKMLPLAKLKAEFPSIVLGNYTLEMLNLKQVYKVFERC